MNLSWTPEETSANGQLVVINPIHTGKVMPNFSWKHRIHPSEFSRCPITPWCAPEHHAQCRGKGPFPYIIWYNLYNLTFYVWIFQFNLPVFVYQRSVLRMGTRRCPPRWTMPRRALANSPTPCRWRSRPATRSCGSNFSRIGRKASSWDRWGHPGRAEGTWGGGGCGGCIWSTTNMKL